MSFDSKYKLYGHSRLHKASFEQSRVNMSQSISSLNRSRYESNPRLCEHCESPIEYNKILSNHAQKFCNNSCAATYNNLKRAGKRSTSLTGPKSNPALFTTYSRAQYRFRFNVADYPELFSQEQRHQWATQPRGSATNLQGLSQDHRLSLSEAFHQQYDPYYITHPVNCELIAYELNCKKSKRSSISYEQLVQEVQAYDARFKKGPASALTTIGGSTRNRTEDLCSSGTRVHQTTPSTQD